MGGGMGGRQGGGGMGMGGGMGDMDDMDGGMGGGMMGRQGGMGGRQGGMGGGMHCYIVGARGDYCPYTIFQKLPFSSHTFLKHQQNIMQNPQCLLFFLNLKVQASFLL